MSPALSPDLYLGLIALGFATGVYGTLIGAGGGFILMPILLLLYPGKNPELLTSISLAVVFFNALSGSGSYAHMKRIDYVAGSMFAAATIPGAVIGALHTGYVPRRLFDIILGSFISLIAVFLLFHPETKQKTRERPEDSGLSRFRMRRHIEGADGRRYCYSFNPFVGLAISFFVGYVSSFLGIGGGIIHVPALVYLLHFPVHIATATSHFILAIMALTGTMVHILTGTFSHGVHQTIALSIGVVIGAQLGALLSTHLKGKGIIKSLALALIVLGFRVLTVALKNG